jgi:iron complex outermembrane receptor protein
VGGYHSFDATIAYEKPTFKLALTAKNLSDNDYFQPFQYFGGGYIGGGRVVPATGAALYFSGSLRF